ncbi:hypothetical protein AXI59_08405 [Bacillus nakamurai]|nr:hypothetical protein AXI59_08405 [Bacillus nakamurai]
MKMDILTQVIVTPALAYPATVLIRERPVAVAENTINNRVCGVTDIFNPVVIPLLMVPIDNIPVRGGDKVTAAPGMGVNVLFGTVELYNCAVIVTVEPTSDKAAVVLKYPAIEVIVPLLGAENAKLRSVPPAPVRSIAPPPPTETPVTEFPKPTRLTVPINPPAMVVKAVGRPDAYGMIAPDPVAPVAPVVPVTPVDPVAPLA